MMESIIKAQIEFLLILQNFREVTNHVFDNFFLFITTFGEILIPVAFLSLVWWVINKKTATYMLWNICYGVFINEILKLTACIYRPWVLDNRIKPIESAIKFAGGYSFPSGHTSMAVASWGAFALKTHLSQICKWAFYLLVLLIAFSRLYIGVHTPQDVFIALLAGIILLFISAKALDWINNGKNRDTYAFITTLILCILFCIYIEVKVYPIDYVNGQLLVDPVMMRIHSLGKIGFFLGSMFGWLLDRKILFFEPDTIKLWKKLVAWVVGLGLLTAIMSLKHVLILVMPKQISDFTVYFIVGIFITFIYPYLMTFLKIKTEA